MAERAGDSGAGSNAGPILFRRTARFELETPMHAESKAVPALSRCQQDSGRSRLYWAVCYVHHAAPGPPPLLQQIQKERTELGEEHEDYFFISCPRIAPPGYWALWMLT
jgi:hypothetical protein